MTSFMDGDRNRYEPGDLVIDLTTGETGIIESAAKWGDSLVYKVRFPNHMSKRLTEEQLFGCS